MVTLKRLQLQPWLVGKQTNMAEVNSPVWPFSFCIVDENIVHKMHDLLLLANTKK